MGAYLSRSFQELELVQESFGKALWKARDNETSVLIRSFAKWSLKEEDLDTLKDRFLKLRETPLSALPRPLSLEDCDGHLILLEEWVEGRPWKEAVLSRESALEFGKELFDLLAELTDLNLVHGQLSPHNLLIESSSGYLKLLGLLSRPPGHRDGSERDLRDALACLQRLIRPDEFTELSRFNSPLEISRRLNLLLCQVDTTGSQSELVGRELAMQDLSEAYSEGGMAAVKAPGGGGKSRLICEWTRLLEDRVLVGKAEKEVAPRPFQLFQEPLALIESELRKNTTLFERLQQELNLTLPLVDSWSGNENQLQRGAIVWLGNLLKALNRYQPTVLVLEDVHWADDFSLSFIEYWSKEPTDAFLVISFRPEEVADDHLLNQIPHKSIELKPLSRAQAERLVRSQHPGASRTQIERATHKAAGNPFLLLQFLRSGHSPEGRGKLGLSELPEKCRRALAVAAILGGEFSLELLAECLGSRPDLGPAQEKGLVQLDGNRARFQHDRYREHSLGLLSEEELSEYHLQAAKAQFNGDNPFAVAYHFWQAGQPQLGTEHALTAAHAARDRDDLSTAIFYFRIALRGLKESDPRHTELSFLLGDCYRLLGRYEESERCFMEVLAAATDPLVKARALHVLGDVHFKQDELQRAREAVLEGLRILGFREPRQLELAFCYEASRLTFRSFFPKEGDPDKAERELLRAALFNRLAYVNWFLEGPVASIWAHFCELNIAQRYGDSAVLAGAQANHAIAMSALPWWSRSVSYGAKSLATAKRIGDRWSEGRVGHFYGAVLLGVGRLAEAEQVLTTAQQLLEQTGDRWEENGVRYHLAIVYYRQGRMEEARELAYQTQQIGVDIGDRLAAGDNLYTLARAQNGKLSRQLLEQEKRYESPDLQRTCELLAAEALLCLREREYSRAVTLLEQACARYREKGVRNLYAASLPCWLATARRLQLQSLNQKDRQPLISAARINLKSALREARKYSLNLPHALREEGLLALLLGAPEAARRALLESRRVAESQSQEQELRINEAVLARLGWLLGTGSPGYSQGGHHLWLLGLDSQDNTEPEDLDRLLGSATSISNCLSLETALFTLCRGCRETLPQVESCLVLSQTLTEEWELACGDDVLGPDPQLPLGDGWLSEPIPELDQELRLVLRLGVDHLPGKQQSLLSFLIAVTTAVLDRARRTATSTLLSRDLRRSSVRLHEEAQRLSRAKEQLLLSERLAVTGRLATGLVHNLRNLNMSVTTTAECLLLDTPGDNKISEGLSEILQAGKKATELLTHLSGINKGDLIGARPTNLQKRMEETKPLLLSLCGPRISLVFQLKSDLWAELDPIQLDRILLNLVVNARDAVSLGGRVTVSLVPISLPTPIEGYPCLVPSGDYCKITVKDNGSGIPEQVLPQVFDLHFTTKGEAGTGVGLATVLEMVQSNQGALTVESGEEGTVFELYFPRQMAGSGGSGKNSTQSHAII